MDGEGVAIDDEHLTMFRRLLPAIALLFGCHGTTPTSAPSPAPPPPPPEESSAKPAPPPEKPGSVGMAKIQIAKNDAHILRATADRWLLDHPGSSQCPTFDDLLKEKLLDSETHAVDPWGKRYKVVCSDGAGVTSAGPDGKWDTLDDIWAGVRPNKK